ncbi:CD40 ligand [Centropristis striata]|uniref:CD40 ligand n=1 Tax=Centropristis striata TaxID=184440 RepID=UPI0027DF8740|nr:CD40 ligand [Centropristis striata]
MINTYQTSLAAPPVPPRLNRSHQVLIPGPHPSQGQSKHVIHFLVGVVLLHLFLSVAAFIYLYQNDKMLSFQLPSSEGKTAAQSDKQDTSYKALARMVVLQPPLDQKPVASAAGYLQWDTTKDHSVLSNIKPFYQSWLTILQPGDYYVYSRVTFSKGHSTLPLASIVKLRKSETAKVENVMQAYCNLNYNRQIPSPCSATQGGLVRLEKGNQLSLWVQDLSLVNYDIAATTFGMYKL